MEESTTGPQTRELVLLLWRDLSMQINQLSLLREERQLLELN